MRLIELADLLGLDIRITRLASSGGDYVATFAGAVEYKVFKSENILRGCIARGSSVASALDELRKTVQGKWLVIDAADPNKRREFGVPTLHAI